MAEAADPAGIAVVSTFEVLRAEYALIWPEDRTELSDLDDYRRRAQANGQAALCLSGGGIRSAAFGLGVLEALSRKKLLSQFHYLSTVSGGGYIGSWLQRWIYEAGGDVAAVADALGATCEPTQVKHLRENTSYLTPRVGLGSNDTWAAAVICVRNVILNWLVFGPLLMLAALMPPAFVAGLVALSSARSAPAAWTAGLVATLSVAVAGWFVAKGLPSYRKSNLVRSGSGDGWLYVRILLPLVAWVLASTSLLTQLPPWQTQWPMGSIVAVGSMVAMGAGLLAGGLAAGAQGRRAFRHDLVGWLLALVAVAIVIRAGITLLDDYGPASSGRCALGISGPRGDHCWRAGIIAFAAPVWLLAAHFVGAIVFAGFRWSSPTAKPEADREWLARVSAIKVLPILIWIFAAGCGLILNWLLADWWSQGDMSLTGGIAAVSGWLALGGGKSKRSGGISDVATGLAKHLSFRHAVAAATFVFIGALFVFLGRFDEHLITMLHSRGAAWWEAHPAHWLTDELGIARSALLLRPTQWGASWLYLMLGIVLLALVLTLSRSIQVNRFSLNGLYRNRLDRGFLGSARGHRIPDPFTGFNSDDNIRMNWLVPGNEPERHAPESDAKRRPFRLYPVINCTLNATDTENLAWQERKAEPFLFTPLYSGCPAVDPVPAGGWSAARRSEVATAKAEAHGAFISSAVYGGNEPDSRLDGAGISLASAMSISGAAASPNMGYHSSAATAFLMTLFNVRLGAWLPNPARAADLGDKVGRSNPSNSLLASLKELAGLTSDEGKDIYLSDGGHFENLGVYEMLRRRCRYIFVSDAGADPDCAFFDLGGVVRKAKIDFDVDIAFTPLPAASRPRQDGTAADCAWAVGTITYPQDGETGLLLYLKPIYFGPKSPVDIQAYAKGSPSFPHESTGDQFFTESQFESYRHLGFALADALGGAGKPMPSIEAFFAAVVGPPAEGP